MARKITIGPYKVPRGGKAFQRNFRKYRLPKRWPARSNGKGGQFRITSRGTWGKRSKKRK